MFTQNAKSRFQAWKQSHNIDDNDLITAGFIAGTITLFVGLTAIAMKQSQAYAEEMAKQEAWEKEQLTNGRVIVPTPDGMHMMSVTIEDIY